MLRRIKKRVRVDAHANQTRRSAGSWARRVYLAMLAGLAVALGDYVWGDMVMLRADGIVLRERTDVASTSLVRVEEVFVKRGQPVAEGERLLKVGSVEVLDAIADQTVRLAELAREEAALRTRLHRTEALLPLAERRARTAAETETMLAASVREGLVTANRLAVALADEYEAQANLVALTAERLALSEEIETLAAASAAAKDALRNLESHYGAGEIRATVGGTVGVRSPAVGEVFAAGAPLLSLHSGPEYVLAYLPRRYLFAVEEGMRVAVSDGRRSATGEIAEILTISQSLPEEFRTAFRPGDRRQLARIRFAEPHGFPVFADVHVGPEWTLANMAQTATAALVGMATAGER